MYFVEDLIQPIDKKEVLELDERPCSNCQSSLVQSG